MDQSAFRALLSSSHNPSTSSGGRGKTTAAAKFGAPPPKRSAAATAPRLNDSTEFKPRNQKDKSKYKNKKGAAEEGNPNSASSYRDRAAERRTGARGDFADAEKLLEDFKARVGDGDDVTKDELEEKMKYLGGDAEHTVLVKGLDMALLERMKAQQAASADHILEDVEDELDLVLAGKAKKAEEKKKRTRDDLIAELKASKGGIKAGGAAGGERVTDPRFKPVGFKPIGQSSEIESKKKKKKKKVKPTTVEAGASADATASTNAPESSKPLPIPQPTIDVEADDDFDIFGDAGEYKGLDTDSDDDDDDKGDKGTATKKDSSSEQIVAPLGHVAAVKMSYFNDDEDEDDDVGRSTAPNSVTNLADSKPTAKRTDSNGIVEEGEEEEEGERSMRLQPLSKSAIPNVKELLAMDAAAEKEEKRKERKQHYQMKAADKKEAALKAMTPQQRAEHEHQVMMTYLEKKERRAREESTKEDDEDDDVANGGF
ncbi:BQ2448_1767 [Microbotryum intermedium]|uniref:BQ2448_1767 protein n=1 Tax=Microbotryum intermedium TaxID=269621 RepID=A0A238FED6_9BASI|nr:BQ2448_1767 [Microbotryum intermedium]